MSDPISKVLRSLRDAKGDSLRDVERATKVSNGYLSQIESGQVKRPSPDKLYALADYFGVPYGELMAAAGHVQPKGEERSASGFELALMSMNLSDDEEEHILRYVNKVLRDH